MELKWVMIGFAACMIAISIDHAVSQDSQNQCKQVYATSNRTAEEIIKICSR